MTAPVQAHTHYETGRPIEAPPQVLDRLAVLEHRVAVLEGDAAIVTPEGFDEFLMAWLQGIDADELERTAMDTADLSMPFGRRVMAVLISEAQRAT